MNVEFDRLEELHEKPLRIVVVGHTNHGKTSMIRTLAKDAKFGDVVDGPRTTTGVHCKRISIRKRPLIEVFDTPGFENLDDLLLDIREATGTDRQPGIDELLTHLSGKPDVDSSMVRSTLEIVKSCHIVVYIIDVREPVSRCYRDEIECLQRSGRPLVVAFNFSKTKQSDMEPWVEYLRDIGVHTFGEYDAHTRTRENEDEFYENIKVLMFEPLYREFLDSWIAFRRQEAEEAVANCVDEICDMAAGTAAIEVVRTKVEKSQIRATRDKLSADLETAVHAKKVECLKAIVDAFDFSWDDLTDEADDVEGADMITKFNVFDASRIRRNSTLGGAVSGATIGGVIDAFVGGASFGAGAAIGGVFGTVTGYFAGVAVDYRYEQGTSKMKATVNDKVILLLLGVCVSAARALKVRGRANPHRVLVAFDEKAFKPSQTLTERFQRKGWGHPDTQQVLAEELDAAINAR